MSVCSVGERMALSSTSLLSTHYTTDSSFHIKLFHFHCFSQFPPVRPLIYHTTQAQVAISEKWRANVSFFPAFLKKGKYANTIKEELLEAIASLDRGAGATPQDQLTIDQNMGQLIGPLAVGKVVGDVVDAFTPAAKIIVLYGSKQVANGCDIKPSLVAERPHVRILGASKGANLYTLVMVDPDAPSPSDPTHREWLHWIVVDIPEGSDATQGRELVMYMGPCPPVGIHRYVFVAFKQTGGVLLGVGAPHGRANFNTRQFASQNNLGLPVAAIYYNSQKEPKNRKR